MGEALIIKTGGKSFDPIQASGGTESTLVIEGIEYKYHVYTTVGNSTLNVTSLGSSGKADILVVAGGGGGSGRHGGGGGAGGLIFIPDYVLPEETSYNITVGAGGIGPNDINNNGNARKGANSVFDDLIALGGGGGGNQSNGELGQPGGSGGGGNYYNSTDTRAGGAGLQPSQSGFSGAPWGHGHKGGSARRVSNTSYPGGGGGGAGDSGDDVIEWNGGKGGNGLNLALYFPNWGTNVNNGTTGIRGWFAGGGGGGVWAQHLPNVGGSGGGGNAGVCCTSSPSNGGNGIANTGGGGGGAGGDASNSKGGDGGSGIVIIRYRLTPID